jgi:6-phosphogluconolactonase
MIRVYADLEKLSQAAAELFVGQARSAVQAQGRFAVALSGGHTPERTYQLLASPPLRGQVPWQETHIFWGDERCVPRQDPLSNEYMARHALLDHVPVPPAHVHPMPCVTTPRECAQRYEALLRSFFAGRSCRFDLIFLGLGENGHTASLFPGTPVLDERERWAAEVYVAEQDLYRVTLTAPLINHAALVAFLVTGAGKAQVLHEVIEGPSDPHRLPAQLIKPTSGELLWLVDEEAAAALQREA